MANKEDLTPPIRQNRKQHLLNRQQQEAYQRLRLLVLALATVIGLILLFGLIYEFGIKPGSPVAVVNEEKITLSDWQRQVRIQRGQTISGIDSLYNMVNGDTNQLGQFAGAQLQSLVIPQVMGEQVLQQLVDEKLVSQELALRGVTISEEAIQAEVESQFDYFGGGLPTPTSEPTQTPMPTPSITPIVVGTVAPTAVVSPTAVLPTATPAPTNTPISEDSFKTQYQERIDELTKIGGTEADYRADVLAMLQRNRLTDLLADEAVISGTLSLEAQNISMFYVGFTTRPEAEAFVTKLGGSDYLTEWNILRSAARITDTQPFASEQDWTTTETISSSFGLTVTQALETVAIDTPTGVLEDLRGDFYVFQVRGREMRPLSENDLDRKKQELLTNWLTEKRQDVVIYSSRWENNTPKLPILDPKYYRPSATATPFTIEATAEVVQPTVEIEATPAP